MKTHKYIWHYWRKRTYRSETCRRLMVNSTASMGHKKSTIQVIAYLKLFSIFKIRVCSHVSHMLLEICQIHWTTVEKKGRNSIHIHTHRQTQG